MDLVIGTLVGILAAFAGVFIYYFMESQRKKQVLIQLLTKALIELNANGAKLHQVYSCVMPQDDADFNELEKKFKLTMEDDSQFMVYHDILQLKTSQEFLAFAEIRIAFLIDSVITRYSYLNKIFEGVKGINNLTQEEIKTLYHGNEITATLIKTLTSLLTKLKPKTTGS